jgi:hypothetical protein
LIIPNAVSVKCAYLSEISDGCFQLQHYNTIILTVRYGSVGIIKPCSMSSIRAINQTLMYLGIKSTCKQIVQARIKNGETIDRSY